MKKDSVLFLILLTFAASIFFTSCIYDPPEAFGPDKTAGLQAELELSSSDVKVNEPVILTAKYPEIPMLKNAIFFMGLLDGMEVKVVEGTEVPYREEILLIDFIRPEQNQDGDIPEEELYPYCKLELTFNKPGTYKIKMKRTYKDNIRINYSFASKIKITVTE